MLSLFNNDVHEPGVTVDLDYFDYSGLNWVRNDVIAPEDKKLKDVTPIDLISLFHSQPEYSLYLLLINNTLSSVEQLNQFVKAYDVKVDESKLRDLKKMGILYTKHYRVPTDDSRFRYTTYYAINPRILPEIITATALTEHLFINRSLALKFFETSDYDTPNMRFSKQITFISAGYQILIKLLNKDYVEIHDFIKVTGGVNNEYNESALLKNNDELFFQYYVSKGFIKKDESNAKYYVTEDGKRYLTILKYCLIPNEILGFKNTRMGYMVSRMTFKLNKFKRTFRSFNDLDKSITDATRNAIKRISQKEMLELEM